MDMHFRACSLGTLPFENQLFYCKKVQTKLLNYENYIVRGPVG